MWPFHLTAVGWLVIAFAAAVLEVSIRHFGSAFVSAGAVAAGAQKIVFLPYEASGIMSSLGGIRELLAPQVK